MFPLQDLNPTRRAPVITYALIATNVLVFVWTLSLTDFQLRALYVNDAVVPRFLTRDPFSLETALDILRSMFFHGSWSHLLGNMLYLWVFGDNVEDRLGKAGYVLFYLFCGVMAVVSQVVSGPQSPVPLIGASGAIAGVLGYYLVTFPSARIRTLVIFFIFIRIMQVPALILLGFWFVLQLFNGVASIGTDAFMSGGVAFWAHAGGFIAGALMGLIVNRFLPEIGLHQLDPFGEYYD